MAAVCDRHAQFSHLQGFRYAGRGASPVVEEMEGTEWTGGMGMYFLDDAIGWMNMPTRLVIMADFSIAMRWKRRSLR
jgi:hypothetical protein